MKTYITTDSKEKLKYILKRFLNIKSARKEEQRNQKDMRQIINKQQDGRPKYNRINSYIKEKWASIYIILERLEISKVYFISSPLKFNIGQS